MTFKPQVFPELADKRLSELTDAQKEDAREDWIRANYGYIERHDYRHIEFLLARIDELREALRQRATVDELPPKWVDVLGWNEDAWRGVALCRYLGDGLWSVNGTSGPKDIVKGPVKWMPVPNA